MLSADIDEGPVLLAADDNNSVLLFVSAVLSTLDQEPEIVTATNGEEALRTVKERTPHVIIMDWEMPVMDGLTAVRQLEATPETAEIPIVMLTGVGGDGDEEMVRMALDAGAIDYVTKPVGPTELVARVESALRIEAVPTPPAIHALLDRVDARSGIGRRIRRVDDSSEVEVVRNRQRDAADAHHAVREGMSPAPGMEVFMIPTRAHDSGRAPF